MCYECDNYTKQITPSGILFCATNVIIILNKGLSLPKENSTKCRKLSNLELSDETQSCDHSNESSQRTYILIVRFVFMIIEESSFS